MNKIKIKEETLLSLLEYINSIEWHEEDHPRDAQGRFTSKSNEFIKTTWFETPENLYYSKNRKEKIKFIDKVIKLLPFKKDIKVIDIKRSKQSDSTYIIVDYDIGDDNVVGFKIRVSDHNPTFNVDTCDLYIYFSESDNGKSKIEEILTPKIKEDIEFAKEDIEKQKNKPLQKSGWFEAYFNK